MPFLKRIIPIVLLILQAGAVFALLYASGRLNMKMYPDSEAYINFNFSSMTSILSHYRTFGYPLMLIFLKKMAIGYETVPFFHFGLHVFSVLFFYFCLLAYGFDNKRAFAASSALFYTATVFMWTHAVATDAPASSWAVIVLGLTFITATRPKNVFLWFSLTVALFYAYQIRPAMLFMVGIIPLFAFLLFLHHRPGNRQSAAMKRFVITACFSAIMPVLLFCGLRFAFMGHFSLTSFGGYSLSGVALHMLSDDIVDQAPGELRFLMEEIQKRRKEQHLVVAEKDEDSVRLYEEYLIPNQWGIAVVTAKEMLGDDPVTIDDKLMAISRFVISHKPVTYLKIVVKTWFIGMGNCIGKEPMVIALFGLMAVLTGIRLARGHECSGGLFLFSRESGLLFVMAWLYVMFGMLLVSIAAPPLTRYINQISVFIPSVLSVLCIDALDRPDIHAGINQKI